MQLHQALRDRQSEAGALFGGLDRVRALAERGEYDRDFILRDAGSGILDAQILPAGSGPADFEPDLAPLRRELDGVAEQIETDLPDRALIRPQTRQVGLEQLVDEQPATFGAHLQEMAALGHHARERHCLLVEL